MGAFSTEREEMKSELATVKVQLETERQQMSTEIEYNLSRKLDQKRYVIFQAIKVNSQDFDVQIVFDKTPINIGEAFNHEDGYFTVKQSGTYFFTFSATTSRKFEGESRVDIR